MIILKVLSTMPNIPNLVSTQCHPLTMPTHAVPDAFPEQMLPAQTPPVREPVINPKDGEAAYMPTINNVAVDIHASTRNRRKRATCIELTALPHYPASTVNETHMQSRLVSDVLLSLPANDISSTEDRAKLAEIQIANERHPRRAVVEAYA